MRLEKPLARQCCMLASPDPSDTANTVNVTVLTVLTDRFLSYAPYFPPKSQTIITQAWAASVGQTNNEICVGRSNKSAEKGKRRQQQVRVSLRMTLCTNNY